MPPALLREQPRASAIALALSLGPVLCACSSTHQRPLDGAVLDAERPRDGGETDAGLDAGLPDLAVVPDLSIPGTDLGRVSAAIEFLDGNEGLGTPVIDANADEAGNVWAVAPDALYILRPGQRAFRRYTNADGLHIYTVIAAVAGAGPDEGYLGLEGHETDYPLLDPPDLASQGKAEHVHLHADGTLTSLHYAELSDDVDPTYTETRSVRRLLYVHDGVEAGHLFMGGNHGVTHVFDDRWGDHVHVEVYYQPQGSGTYGLWWGLAVDPVTHGLWTCGKNACGRQAWNADPRAWVQGRYDTAFTVFTDDHALEVPNGYTESFVGAAATSDGRAYLLSAPFGLAEWSAGKLRDLAVPGLGTPVDIVADTDDTLWVTDGAQLLRYDPVRGGATALALPPTANDIRRLSLDRRTQPRALYISTGGGLVIYRGP